MKQKPCLILSDAPTANTGLARIGRDLANRMYLHLSTEYRVATLGYAGTGSRHYPWPQYSIQTKVGDAGWYVPELMHVWQDFAGGDEGIVFTIWDPSRMAWFARPSPDTVPHKQIAAWLAAAPFQKWGYLPVDASGPNGKLSASLRATITGYDRAICYSKWAEEIVRNTVGPEEADRLQLTSLPHGIDTTVFKPRPKAQARTEFRKMGFTKLRDSDFLVGIVATNQARKDYGLGMETCARLLQQGVPVKVWIHVDTIRRHWDLVALVTDFGLMDRVVITTENFRDEEMSWLYSACDVTLGIGLGEGFGYCGAESLACGVPIVHGNYGGFPEHMQAEMLVESVAWRLEGQWNCLRPVFKPQEWAHTAIKVSKGTAELPSWLNWVSLWPNWEAWFRKGV